MTKIQFKLEHDMSHHNVLEACNEALKKSGTSVLFEVEDAEYDGYDIILLRTYGSNDQKKTKEIDISGSTGVVGSYGPNDYGYIHAAIVRAAKELKIAQELYSQGHYPHSKACEIPMDHPLRTAMEAFAILDKEYAHYANEIPDPDLFSTYRSKPD